MKIALDYDETITRDPELWFDFVTTCQGRGHDVRIVTFRHANMSNSDLIDTLRAFGINIPVIFTGGNRKRQYCASVGFFPDVWIDDMPELICRDDTYIPGEMLAKQMAYQTNVVPFEVCDCNRLDCLSCKEKWEG